MYYKVYKSDLNPVPYLNKEKVETEPTSYQKLVLPYPQSFTFAIVSRCFENEKIIVVKQKCHLFIKQKISEFLI